MCEWVSGGCTTCLVHSICSAAKHSRVKQAHQQGGRTRKQDVQHQGPQVAGQLRCAARMCSPGLRCRPHDVNMTQGAPVRASQKAHITPIGQPSSSYTTCNCHSRMYRVAQSKHRCIIGCGGFECLPNCSHQGLLTVCLSLLLPLFGKRVFGWRPCINLLCPS